MSTKKWLLGCGVVGSLMVLALAVVAVLASVPEVSQQVMEEPGSVYVMINKPLNGDSLPLNQPITVYVHAFGEQAIRDVQLLADGRPVPNGISSTVDGKKKIVSWVWTPVSPGAHTLIAQASSQDGQNNISNVVNVNAMGFDQIPLPVLPGEASAPPVISAEAGQPAQAAEPEDISSEVPADLDLSALLNPPPFPSEPVSQEPAIESAPPAKSSLIPIKYSLWAQNLLGPIVPVSPPEAPTLDGGSNQCDAILMIKDNSTTEVGFNLYRLDPGLANFLPLAILDGQSGQAAFSYIDPGLAGGEYLYYLEAFNAAGNTSGNIIHITVSDPQCLVAKPSASQLFNKIVKVDPGTPVEKAYCYGAANTYAWVRMPAGQDNFIYPQNGQIDLSPYWDLIVLPQPMPPSVTLTLDCWGWNGSALNYLGKFSQTINSESGPTQPPKPGKATPSPAPDSDLKVAAPFNAKISNNPEECKSHVPVVNANASVVQCKGYMESSGGFLLFWDYNRFGNCNPQAEACDMSYQPAYSFNYYRVENGKTINMSLPTLGTGFNYLPVLEKNQEFEYFVRAYIKDPNVYGKIIESEDSNHVTLPKPLEMTVQPTIVETYRFSKYFDGSPVVFAKTSGASPPNGLLSGYAWVCKNGNPCAVDQFHTTLYIGLVRFPVPQDIEIASARINWKNHSYTADGPGLQDIILSCEVSLHAHGGSLSNSSLWGSENYDVTQTLEESKLAGDQTVKFLFIGPMGKEPTIAQWDRCIWEINQLSMTVNYYQIK